MVDYEDLTFTLHTSIVHALAFAIEMLPSKDVS